MRMLDLCCGRLGWSKAFLARGWECVGVDLVTPTSIPAGFTFRCMDILDWRAWDLKGFDFACASTPCEEFSKHGLRCFFPDPPYPALGIELFNHGRSICEAAGIPYVMENVRAAQKFVGPAASHCGPFYLWGNAVPPLLPQGIIKGMTRKALGHHAHKGKLGWNTKNQTAGKRLDGPGAASLSAMIPPELAACVADYAGRICEAHPCT